MIEGSPDVIGKGASVAISASCGQWGTWCVRTDVLIFTVETASGSKSMAGSSYFKAAVQPSSRVIDDVRDY